MTNCLCRWVLLPALLLAACSQPPAVYREQLPVFGTLVEVSLFGVEEPRAQELVAQLARDFDTWHHAWHAWHPGPLGEVNDHFDVGKTVVADAAVVPLIRRGRELAAQSGDLFNPAIGRLIGLWGFGSDEPPHGPPPEAAAIRALVAQRPRMTDIELDGNQVRSRNPAVRLDFGAFAKGYAVDRAIERLRAAGVANAIVNAGGDLRALGRHGERPWRIGIRHPRASGVLAAVEIDGDESVFTSGDYERYFEWDRVRYQHIIDPRSGYPAKGVSSVTVFARQGDLADAAATAILVAGPADWLPVARALGVSGVMLVQEDGTVQMTPNLRARIQFEGEPPKVVISAPLPGAGRE